MRSGRVWDAGDRGCVGLVLELKRRVEELRPGEVLEIVARDAGARSDIPAWCRLAGHVLLPADPPVFRIRRSPISGR